MSDATPAIIVLAAGQPRERATRAVRTARHYRLTGTDHYRLTSTAHHRLTSTAHHRKGGTAHHRLTGTAHHRLTGTVHRSTRQPQFLGQ